MIQIKHVRMEYSYLRKAYLAQFAVITRIKSKHYNIQL